jgi:hypothetical protein
MVLLVHRAWRASKTPTGGDGYSGIRARGSHCESLSRRTHDAATIPVPFSTRDEKGCEAIVHLFAELFSESVLRLILTEGEKVVLAAKGNLSSQGIYDVISGLGALIVRLVFRLWEDFAFSAWSRPDDGTDDQPSDAALRHMASAASPKRTEAARAKFSEPSAAPAYVTVAKWDLLFAMLKIAVHFGALAAAFGPPLAARVLWSLFGGSRTSDWTGADAVDVLVAYIYYIPLLGVNGLLEAFVRATSTEHALRRLKGWMVLCSLAYIALCYVSLFVFDLGAVGLLYANSINLAIRIAVSAFTIETGVASPSGLSLSGRGDDVSTTWWVARATPNAAVLTTYIVAFASARIVPLLFSVARSRHEDSVGLRVTDVNPPAEPSAAPAYVTVAKWDLLFAMLKIAVHFGALAAAFGPPLAARVLWSLFGGSRTSDWTGADAVDVLVAYIYYIPLLGVNGLLEAFVRATSTPPLRSTRSAASRGGWCCARWHTSPCATCRSSYSTSARSACSTRTRSTWPFASPSARLPSRPEWPRRPDCRSAGAVTM